MKTKLLNYFLKNFYVAEADLEAVVQSCSVKHKYYI